MRWPFVVISLLAMAGTALATVTADPPGPNNRVSGANVPNGTYRGRMEFNGGTPDGDNGYILILTQPFVRGVPDDDPNRPPEDPDDFPIGTRIGFQPATDAASGEASEVEAASDKAVGQKDGDNEVTVNNGKVDSVRTAPDATRGDG